MKKSKILLLSALAAAAIACSQEKSGNTSLNKFDLQEILATRDTLSFEDANLNVQAIQLSFPDDRLYGNPSIITGKENEYIVCFRSPGEIIRFDSNGKFMNIVARKGKAASEYSGVDQIWYDNEGNIVVHYFGKLKVYSPEGKYLKTIDVTPPIETKFGAAAMNKKFLDRDGNLHTYYPMVVMTEIYEASIQSPEGDTIMKKDNPWRFEPTVSMINISVDNRIYYYHKDDLVYHPDKSDTIYNYNPKSIAYEPRYVFNNSDPTTMTAVQDYEKMRSEVTKINDFVENDKYIFISILPKDTSPAQAQVVYTGAVSVDDLKRNSKKSLLEHFIIDKSTGKAYVARLDTEPSLGLEFMFTPKWDAAGKLVNYWDEDEKPQPTLIVVE